MTEVEKSIEQQNSVEISVNAKQMFSGKVKVYAETIESAMEQAVKKANELQQLINMKNNSV